MPIDPLIRFDRKGLLKKPQLTQGAIIQGLKFPSYSAAPYHGFVITARCDLAQLKTDTLNILPIVPLKEWLRFSCAISILQRRLITLSQKIVEKIKKLDPELLYLFREDFNLEVFNAFVKDNVQYDKNEQKNLRTQLIEYNELRSALEKCRTHSDVKYLLKENDIFSTLFQNNIKRRINDAVKNNDADVHYLPVVKTSSDIMKSDGYIILFRHILSIPAEFSDILENGCVEFGDNDPVNNYLIAPSGVISNIRSPHVEHIMQRFSFLYSRIGVEDYSEIYLEEFTSRICKMETTK